MRAKTKYPPPPRDFNVGGFSPTGEVRLRATFFGFAIIEEKIEYRDGRIVWKRLRWPGTVKIQGAA